MVCTAECVLISVRALESMFIDYWGCLPVVENVCLSKLIQPFITTQRPGLLCYSCALCIAIE